MKIFHTDPIVEGKNETRKYEGIYSQYGIRLYEEYDNRNFLFEVNGQSKFIYIFLQRLQDSEGHLVFGGNNREYFFSCLSRFEPSGKFLKNKKALASLMFPSDGWNPDNDLYLNDPVKKDLFKKRRASIASARDELINKFKALTDPKSAEVSFFEAFEPCAIDFFQDDETTIAFFSQKKERQMSDHAIILVPNAEWDELSKNFGVVKLVLDTSKVELDVINGTLEEGSSAGETVSGSANQDEEDAKREAARKQAEEVAEAAKKQQEEADKKLLNLARGEEFPDIFTSMRRSQLDDLVKRFGRDRVLGIYGPTGIGKTQVALSFLSEVLQKSGEEGINRDRVNFIDCAQIGFDEQFIKCLQRLAAPKNSSDEELIAVRKEIRELYPVLSPSREGSEGNERTTFAKWFDASHWKERRFILLDNCGELLLRKSTSQFIKALNALLRDDESCLTLILTFKQAEVKKKLDDLEKREIENFTVINLYENLNEREVDEFLETKVSRENVARWKKCKSLWRFLNDRKCATPLIISFLFDIQERLSELTDRLEKEVPAYEGDESDEVDEKREAEEKREVEKRRRNVMKILVDHRLANIGDDARRALASMIVLSQRKAGNQVARLPRRMIERMYTHGFGASKNTFHGAFTVIKNLKICSEKSEFFSFKHEVLQELVQDWFPDKDEFRKYRRLAGRLFEKYMLELTEREHVVKWAMSAAHQYIECGEFAAAADIIDGMDPFMRTAFLYNDCWNVRLELEKRLAASLAQAKELREFEERLTSEKTEESDAEKNQRDIYERNLVDQSEILYQGLDDWDLAATYVSKAGAGAELKDNAEEWKIQGRHLRKILVYEKTIEETIKADAMDELKALNKGDKPLDESIMANILNTDGMYLTRDENYKGAVKSYYEAAHKIEAHKGKLDSILANSGLRDGLMQNGLMQTLSNYLNEWVALEGLRYYSNLASAESLYAGPKDATDDLEDYLAELAKVTRLPITNSKSNIRNQDFQYYNLNRACLDLAFGDIAGADERLIRSGELPNEEWFFDSSEMLMNIVKGYAEEDTDLTKAFEDLEVKFKGADPRNCAFARFNKVTHRINRLLRNPSQDQANNSAEWCEIFCELLNVLYRPFWLRKSEFLDADPEINKDKIIELCHQDGLKRLEGLAAYLPKYLAEAELEVQISNAEKQEGEEKEEWELGNGHLCDAINEYIDDDFNSCRDTLRTVGTEGAHLEKILDRFDLDSISEEIQRELDRHRCYERVRSVLRPILKKKKPKDLVHEYPFAARVVSYTSRVLYEQLLAAKVIDAEFPEELILNVTVQDRDVVERYYGGLMKSGKMGIPWRAPFLMPRIVLLRSKPTTPSKDSFEKTCAWLKRIEEYPA